MFKKLLYFFIISSILSSCYLLPGDAAFKIKGEIISARNDTEYDLKLYLAKSDEFCDSQRVTTQFETSLGIARKLDKYYLIVSTIDGQYFHKTKLLVLGGKDTYITPIDLGKISLLPIENRE